MPALLLALCLSPQATPQHEPIVDQIRSGLRAIQSNLQVATLIPQLENRYGCFADLDRDGDLDYVATEMIHGREEVRIHLREGDRWRRGSKRGKRFNQKHPLIPHVLKDDGTGHAAIVLPVGWPPHLYLLRTDGRGRFQGQPIALGKHLPPRISRAAGVDNCPYEITRCVAASAQQPAVIHGVMHDRDGDRTLDVSFRIALEGRTPRGTRTDLPQTPTIGHIPTKLRAVRSPARCRHETDERHAIVATRIRDLTADGTADLVAFSGVFAAHVFPGFLSSDGVISFPSELSQPRDLPIEDLRFWFPIRFSPSNGFPQLQRIGFRIEENPALEPAFTILTTRRKGWLLSYYWTGKRLVPVTQYRAFWPKSEGFSFSDRHRRVRLLDANHDGGPDVLSVHVGRTYRWVKPPPKNGSTFLKGDETKERFPGKLQAGIVHGLGDCKQDTCNRTLFVFPEFVELPDNPNAGYPIELEYKPVYANGATRDRFCVLFRPKKLGIFFEVGPRPDNATLRTRELAAWMWRAEQRLTMREYYWPCDRKQCSISETLHPEVFADAAFFFERALAIAKTRTERAQAHHGLARCHTLAQDLPSAQRAYEQFVMLGRAIEPIDRHHVDLGPLFADEGFRRLHRRWDELINR